MKRNAFMHPVLVLCLTLASTTSLARDRVAKPRPSAPPRESLTRYDKEIIKDYTARGYFISVAASEMINPGEIGFKGLAELNDPELRDLDALESLKGPMFRGGEPENSMNDYQYIAQLNRALDKLPAYGVPGKTLVYRGIYSTSSTQTPEQRFPVGRIWIERRFSSATTDLAVAKQFAMGLYKNEGCGGCPQHVQKPNPRRATILMITQRTGREITHLSAKKEEREVLFKSGVIFKVTEAKRDEKKRYIVKISELDPANLSPEDHQALKRAEAQRLGELLKNTEVSLSADVAKWNEAHEKWKANGLLDREIDFEALMEEGGG